MPTSVITPEQAGQLLVNAFIAIIVGGFGGAPITEFVVSLLKRIPQLANVSSGLMNGVTALALTVVFWIAQSLGLANQFKSLADALLVIGPAVLGLLTTMTGASLAYKTFRAADVPLVGYSRSAARADALTAHSSAQG